MGVKPVDHGDTEPAVTASGLAWLIASDPTRQWSKS